MKLILIKYVLDMGTNVDRIYYLNIPTKNKCNYSFDMSVNTFKFWCNAHQNIGEEMIR